MSRYTDSVCRLCRNEGKKLFLKGTRCETPKCAIERRAYPTGQHGQARKKLSEYATQLREKQKERRRYLVSEKQFHKYYAKAAAMKGVTGTVLFQFLEARLDNVVYRSGLCLSRPQSRQMINHGHFLVNGKPVNIPSYMIKVDDIVTPRPKSVAMLKKLIELRGTAHVPPRWMEVDFDNMAAKVIDKVERGDIDKEINEQLIIEYYSR